VIKIIVDMIILIIYVRGIIIIIIIIITLECALIAFVRFCTVDMKLR